MGIEKVERKREEDKWYGELERVDKEKQKKEEENRTVKI